MTADVRHLFQSLADGWANPETHAAYLVLTADEGLEETATEALATAELVLGDVSAQQAGETLSRLLTRYMDELEDAGLEDERQAVAAQVGSLWRVDWTEIGAAFLSEDREAA